MKTYEWATQKITKHTFTFLINNNGPNTQLVIQATIQNSRTIWTEAYYSSIDKQTSILNQIRRYIN